MAKQNPKPFFNHGGIVIGKRRYNRHVQCSGMHCICTMTATARGLPENYASRQSASEGILLLPPPPSFHYVMQSGTPSSSQIFTAFNVFFRMFAQRGTCGCTYTAKRQEERLLQQAEEMKIGALPLASPLHSEFNACCSGSYHPNTGDLELNSGCSIAAWTVLSVRSWCQ
jgi:hypothetical protein